MMENVVQDGAVPIKSASDNRLYQVVHLKNGLVSLLIHDPVMAEALGSSEEVETGNDGKTDSGKKISASGKPPTKKAAAAMSVGVGSFSDPADAQGLAHFLEHMLFMGSSKFPAENEFFSFISKHGGYSNAFTELESTCYYFDVNQKSLKPALDRFSQFFISPLASPDALDREIQAIQSEFQGVQQSDSCRLHQVQCHSTDPSHPFHSFIWGNQKSLGDPMAEGVDLRGKMLEIYKEHYLAGRMKLAVLSGESLDTMKAWVAELFGDIREGGTDMLTFEWAGPTWEEGKLYRVEAVKDVHLLSLLFPLPSQSKQYREKGRKYLTHFIEHEGLGSLLSCLKNKGWATGITAGAYYTSTAGDWYDVTIGLTIGGMEKVLEVIGLFFQYIKMLRDIGPQEWVFEELRDMAQIKFKFSEETSSASWVLHLASNMHDYTEENIIYGRYAYEEWDTKLINELLALINPHNTHVDVLSKKFDNDHPDIEMEPWFGVRYYVEPLPDELLKTWANPPSVDPSLHMPVVNNFIPRDFTVYASNEDCVDPAAPDFPRVLVEDAGCKVWYKLDRTFNTPKANTFFRLTCPAAAESARSSLLTALYVSLLRDALQETTYLAAIAKLVFSMSVSGDKLVFHLFGFNDKLHVLGRSVAELCTTLVPRGDRFQVMKENMERGYRNMNLKPLSQSSYLKRKTLEKPFWDADEMLASLMTLRVEDVTSFIPKLFEKSYMEALCHGNFSEEDALNISNIFKNALVLKEVSPEFWIKERVHRLPVGSSHVLTANAKNESEENSVVQMYFQVGQDRGRESIRDMVKMEIFGQLISEPFFNQLRTKEQLGYALDSRAQSSRRVVGHCFRIQSSKYNPDYLQERMNAFIATIPETLRDVSDEEFQTRKEISIEEKLERSRSQFKEACRHWIQIYHRRCIFEHRELEAKELRTLEKSEIVDWYNTYIRPECPELRKLSIHIWGKNSREEKQGDGGELSEQVKRIDDLDAFRDRMDLYPAFE